MQPVVALRRRKNTAENTLKASFYENITGQRLKEATVTVC
jgi:hypothetical protein